MFVVYRTKGLNTIGFICVFACMSVYVLLLYCKAYLFHIIVVSSKSSYELNESCSQNIYDTFVFTVL